MTYRVLIPTAGIGSRLNKLTKYINKSLVSISHRPIICHLIEKFPKDCEFVIALGYKGELVRDFLELTYPDRTFFFANVEVFQGAGSGLGLSLISCEKFLQQPFIFLSCDTLFKGKISKPTHNWMGYAERDNLSEYRTLQIDNNKICGIHEKGIIKNNLKAYIGLAGIYDYRLFWKSMHEGKSKAITQGEVFGMKAILKSKSVYANNLEWFDTGNTDSLKLARKEFSEQKGLNILEKNDEAIWFVGNNVIKYSNNTSFISNRVRRGAELKGFVPKIVAQKPNMYKYKLVKGETLSKVINLPIFENFIQKCEQFWLKKKLSDFDQEQFKKKCMSFYKDKTFERINLFYTIFNQTDNAKIINGQETPLLEDLLNKIDWDWISNGIPGRYHGDFHFENILYEKKDKSFIFLDWRQDFAGDLFLGDIYYDLAKLMHGMIVNHGIIFNDHYKISWKDNIIDYEFYRKQSLVECEQRFNHWIQEKKYDLNKIRILTGLIYLNIAALHHYPYSLLLYGLGKNILNKEIR